MKSFFTRLYKLGKNDFFSLVENALAEEKKMFIVTANPETFCTAETDNEMRSLLCDDNTTIVADGIGVVKGAAMLNIKIQERIPGVELSRHLLGIGDKFNKSVFLFGASQDVLDKLCFVIAKDYPSLKIVGSANGYDEDKDSVFDTIKSLSPDICFVALGIPTQEKLIYKHLKDFSKGIFIGVGGTFDVLSGIKSRAPDFFINHNLEWLYRIVKEPKRLKRFYNNNVKFFFKLTKELKNKR